MLTGPGILEQMQQGRIRIDPFDAACLNPNSYDLHLADELLTYNLIADAMQELRERCLIVGKQNSTYRFSIPPHGFVLQPGELYLAHTVEFTETLYPWAPQINGKSSLGRLGLNVHQTAGFGDVGFRGTWTLELTVVHPMRVFAGIRVCQIAYTRSEGPEQAYAGRYQDQRKPTEYIP